jgi:D-xylose 1-dehydrogenase (NADP+, D-xylono-1,5-lactone-forming)
MIDEAPIQPLRIGVLGTARIARSFIAGVAPSQSVAVTAVASRDAPKARELAAATGVPRACGSYEELLADSNIDAIYNPLPNSLHALWSMRALETGKHVLCEKPLATSSHEAHAMFDAAQAHGLRLVEAFPYRSQPHAIRLRELVAATALGELRTIQAGTGFTLREANNIRLDPALGGGALLDVGTYPVSLVRMLAGQRPARVCASARWTERGVDETLIASLEHPSGLLAQISCSFATGLHREALIAGTGGVLRTNYLNTPPPGRPAVMHWKRGASWDEPYETIEVPALNGFRAEAESFEQLIRRGPTYWTGATPAESLDIMCTLEAILRSARERVPVDLVD